MSSSPPIRNSRSYRTLAAAIVVAAVIVAASILASSAFGRTTTETSTLTVTSTNPATLTTATTGLQGSGPIDTYPAGWSIFSGCPGSPQTGNTTTLSNLPLSYPDSWNTTTVVTLGQVYGDVVSSSAFTTISAGHGWVVYSWSFIEDGPTTPPQNSDDIVGYFILTNGASPDGYVTAYYDIENGSVTLTSVTTTVTVNCTTFTTSSSTTLPSSCTTTFPGGLNMTSGDWSDANQSSEGLRLFTMQPGSVALLCVSYTLEQQALQSSGSPSQNATFSGNAYVVAASCGGGGCSYNYTKASGISITGSPPSITLVNGDNLTTVNVIYTISASSSSQGFYSLTYFNSCPALLPFAVLPPGQTANGSDFNGFFLPGSCIQYGALEDGIVTGVAGMNVSWIYG